MYRQASLATTQREIKQPSALVQERYRNAVPFGLRRVLLAAQPWTLTRTLWAAGSVGNVTFSHGDNVGTH